jgi:hypothetical protein
MSFTGISGSAKSSLVFGSIATESQRLINETYSAFVQGSTPTLARPELDVLERPDDRECEDSNHLLAPAMDPQRASPDNFLLDGLGHERA